MKWITLLGFGAAALTASPLRATTSLDDLLEPTGSIWKQNSPTFLADHSSLGFRWVSTTHDTARAQHLTFHDLPVYETLARFDHDALTELTLSLYNRGDAGTLSVEEFQQLLTAVDEKLTAWSGAKGIVFKTQERTATADRRPRRHRPATPDSARPTREAKPPWPHPARSLSGRPARCGG